MIDFNAMHSKEASSSDALLDCTNQPSTPVRSLNDDGPPEAKRKKIKVMGVQLNYDQVGILAVDANRRLLCIFVNFLCCFIVFVSSPSTHGSN